MRCATPAPVTICGRGFENGWLSRPHRGVHTHLRPKGRNECIIAATTALMLLGDALFPVLGSSIVSESALGIAMAAMLVERVRMPPPESTKAIRIVVAMYAAWAVLDHLVVNQRPYTILQFAVGPGALFLMASIDIQLEHFDWLVYFLTVACVITSIAFAGPGSVITPDGRIALYIGDPDVIRGSKHLTGFLGLILFVIPSWKAHAGVPRRWWQSVFCWLIGAGLTLLSGSRGYIAGMFLFACGSILHRVCHGRIQTAAMLALAGAALLGGLVLLVIPDASAELSFRLPAGLAGDTRRHDVTTGREVLVLQHMALYQSEPVWGLGRFDIKDHFSPDLIVGGPESYMTYAMARDGIGGMLNVLLVLAICWYGIGSRSPFTFAYSLFFPVFFGSLGGLSNLYNTAAFVLFSLLFSRSQERPFAILAGC